MLEGLHPQFAASLVLGCDVRQRGRVVTYQYGGQPWDNAVGLPQTGNLQPDFFTNGTGNRLPVDDLRSHAILSQFNIVTIHGQIRCLAIFSGKIKKAYGGCHCWLAQQCCQMPVSGPFAELKTPNGE